MKTAFALSAVFAAVSSTAIAQAGASPPYLSASPPAVTAADTRFDGTWAVNLDCPTHVDGAFGYVYEFVVQVKDGRLSGEHGEPGRPGWLLLEGQIRADGSAALYAKGLTGDSKYSAGHVRKSLPYSYRATARFEGSKGSGRRIETRVCTFSFTRN